MSQGHQPTSTGNAATSTNPNRNFETVTMDFINGLPEHNKRIALMVCYKKPGKLTRLIPTWVVDNQLDVPKVAKMAFANWVWHYWVPRWLIRDCNMQFTVIFWCAL